MMGSKQIAHLLLLLVPEKAHRQNMVSLTRHLRVHIVIDGEEEVQKGPPLFNRFHSVFNVFKHTMDILARERSWRKRPLRGHRELFNCIGCLTRLYLYIIH